MSIAHLNVVLWSPLHPFLKCHKYKYFIIQKKRNEIENTISKIILGPPLDVDLVNNNTYHIYQQEIHKTFFEYLDF